MPLSPLKSVAIIGCGWLGRPLLERLRNENPQLEIFATTRMGRSHSALQNSKTQHLIFSPQVPLPTDSPIFSADAVFILVPPQGFSSIKEFETMFLPLLTRSSGMMIYSSSTSVYGKHQGLVDETSETLSDEPNGRVCIALEDILRSKNSSINIIRFGGLIGKDRHPVRHLSGRSEIPDGDAPVNLIHQTDAVAVLHRVLTLRSTGLLLNAVCDEHRTRREFYTQQAKILGLAPPHFQTESKDQKPTHKSYRVVRNDRLKQLLGFHFVHPTL